MPTIYIDMDGVLADFNTKAREVLGATEADSDQAAQVGRWPREKWETLKEIYHFYRILPKTPFADRVMELARRYRDELGWKLYILTAIPSGNDVPQAFQDKVEWIQEYYPDVEVHFGPYSRDKAHHCRPGYILVDDRYDNCESWTQAGGQAIRVLKDPEPALKELAETFQRYK
jgi:5'(3')-deoxyribonucleotidase